MKVEDVVGPNSLNTLIEETFSTEGKVFQEFRLDGRDWYRLAGIIGNKPGVTRIHNAVLVYEHSKGILILIRDE